MYQPSVQLELNDTPFHGWKTITLVRGINVLATLNVTLPNHNGRYTTLPVEDMAMKLRFGWGTDTPPVQFDGYHDDPYWGVAKRNMSMGVNGRDFGRILFDEATVDSAFDPYGNPIGSGYIIDYLQYLADNLSTPLPTLFSQNTVGDVNSAFEYVFGHGKVLEEVNRLSSYGGYEWYMGFDTAGNRQWYMKKPLEAVSSNASHAFIVGEASNYTDLPPDAAIHHISRLNVRKQYGFKKNYVKVQGDGVSAVYPLSPPADPKHLYHEDSGIVASGDALAIAEKLWQARSAPKILVDFAGVGVENLRVGDIIYANDHRYGLSQLTTHIFKLIEIADTFTQGSGWTASFKVADYAPTMFEFFDDTTGL